MRSSTVRFTENPQMMGMLSGAAMALGLTLTLLKDEKPFGVPAPVIGACLAIAFVLFALRSLGVSITVTPQSITRRSPFGECRIAWAEMDGVEIGPGCTTLLFHGNGKRLWMCRPAASLADWFRREEDDYDEPLVELVLGMAEANDVPASGGWFTPFKTSRA